MELITNHSKKNHFESIKKLIGQAKQIVICSGWLKMDGLKEILPYLKQAIKKQTPVTIYSNKKHTDSEAIEILKKFPQITHILSTTGNKVLHSKLHYFERKNGFTALIGSANITYGGLVKSEELSIKISDKLNSPSHLEIKAYLNFVKKLYK